MATLELQRSREANQLGIWGKGVTGLKQQGNDAFLDAFASGQPLHLLKEGRYVTQPPGLENRVRCHARGKLQKTLKTFRNH